MSSQDSVPPKTNADPPTPSIQNTILFDDCGFTVETHDDNLPIDAKYYFVPFEPVTKHNENFYSGHVVVKHNNTWRIVTGNFDRSRKRISCRMIPAPECLAYPIDDQMTVNDIDGAIIIEQNEDGTAWVFHHSGEGVHHDHLLAVHGVIDSTIQPELNKCLHDALTKPDDVDRQRVLVRYGILNEFLTNAKTQATENEKAISRGHYHRERHTDVGLVHTAAHTAITGMITTLRSTKTGRYKYNKAKAAFVRISTTLATRHTPKARWEHTKSDDTPTVLE